ncbi:MAG TPA: potassium/proton antiporter, partial [Actinopolymorphaceae bacterium]
MTIDPDGFGRILLLVSAVLLVAVFAARLSGRLGLPSLLLFLGLGLFIGEEGALGVEFDDTELARILSFAALILILAEGGLSTRWDHVRRSMPLGIVLSTVGVAASTGVVAAFAHVVLGLDWRPALLLGAVTAATDAAAVFSVLRKVPLPRRISGALEAESGLNDAPTVLLVTLLSTAGTGAPSGLALIGEVVRALALGAAIGLAAGWGGGWLVRRVGLPASGPLAVAVFGFVVLAFGGATVVHASGFAAVYVASLVLGNSGLPYRRTVLSFAEGLAWIAQIGLFVMLGLLVWLDRIEPVEVLAALAVGLVLTFVARPLSVAISALPFRLPWRDQAFIAWAGLRGAVPIVLATIALAEHGALAQRVFDIVFVLVVVFTLLQAPTLPYVAKRLGLAEGGEHVDELDVEVAPLQLLDADLLEWRVVSGSHLIGVEISELHLPPGVSVAMLFRGGRPIDPSVETRLAVGDEVLVVAPVRLRQQT